MKTNGYSEDGKFSCNTTLMDWKAAVNYPSLGAFRFPTSSRGMCDVKRLF